MHMKKKSIFQQQRKIGIKELIMITLLRNEEMEHGLRI